MLNHRDYPAGPATLPGRAVPLIYLVAGEASGDVLGSRLMAALRAARPDASFAGVAGPRMRRRGWTACSRSTTWP